MKILDIAFKDIVRSFRSLFMIGMTVVAPLAITGIIYLAFGGFTGGSSDLPATRVGIVNLDEPVGNLPALGDELENMMRDESVSQWLVASDYADEASARAAVDSQEIGVAIIIPRDFSASVLRGSTGDNLLMVQDPTLTVGPMVVENMVNSFLDGVNGATYTLQVVQERLGKYGVTLNGEDVASIAASYADWYTRFERTLYHTHEAALVTQTPTAGEDTQGENAGSMQSVIALIMAGQIIFFAFYTGAYSMMSILKEDEEGTLARLFTTPTDRTAILGGKFLAVVLTVILQSLVLLLVGKLLFGISWGKPLPMALTVISQVIAASGLGVLLISFVKTSKQAGPVLGGGLSALGMLGGLFTVAVPNMPAGFVAVSRFTPQGWVLETWKAALANSAVSELLLPAGVATLLGVVMFAAGAVFFRRRYA